MKKLKALGTLIPVTSFGQKPYAPDDNFAVIIEANVDEIVLVAFGIILVLISLKALKYIANKILGRIGRNIEVAPQKLKDLVDNIQKGATTDGGLTGRDLLAMTAWKSDLFAKIDAGEITTIKGITDHIDATQETMFEYEDLDEGNKFSEARQKAIDAGKDEFEVDGKKYKVKGDKDTPSLDERNAFKE
jgi:hypothetical protein